MPFNWETADAFEYNLLKKFAKENRKKMTQAESILWDFLKKGQIGSPFRKQHIIGKFIADFICLPSKLIVEIDGGYHSLPDQMVSDEERTEFLEGLGYKVIRFTNEQVFCDIDNVLDQIKKNL